VDIPNERPNRKETSATPGPPGATLSLTEGDLVFGARPSAVHRDGSVLTAITLGHPLVNDYLAFVAQNRTAQGTPWWSSSMTRLFVHSAATRFPGPTPRAAAIR